jgi:Holliday junction resolvase-like predicted endonuclease
MMSTLDHYRDQPHWSYSSINGLLNICALQWAMRKIYAEPAAFTPVNLAFGKAFHRAATYWSSRRMSGETVHDADVLRAFAEHWRVEQEMAEPPIRWDSDDQPGLLLDKGQQMLAALIAATPATDRVVGVAVPFSVTLYDAQGQTLPKVLIGEIDLVVETPTGTVLVDWKTAASRWPVEKAHRDLQPTVYLYAWHRMHPGRPASFRYDVVTKAKTPVVEHHHTLRSTDDYHRLAELVRGIDRMVDHGLYLPRPESFACGGCQYADACTQWHRAAA